MICAFRKRVSVFHFFFAYVSVKIQLNSITLLGAELNHVKSAYLDTSLASNDPEIDPKLMKSLPIEGTYPGKIKT